MKYSSLLLCTLGGNIAARFAKWDNTELYKAKIQLKKYRLDWLVEVQICDNRSTYSK